MDDFKPAPEVGDLASVIKRNNEEARRWYKDMLSAVNELQDTLKNEWRRKK